MTSQPETSGYLDVSGARLFYESSGSGPALVLVHAGIADSRMWDEQVEAFSNRFTVVRYDMRNFGQTVAGDAAFADWEDLVALLAARSIESAFILGASMGATVAVALALERPELVRGLILVSPGIFPGHRPSSELSRGWGALSRALDAGQIDRALDIELDMWVDRSGKRTKPAHARVRERVREMNARAYELASDAPNRKPLKPPALTRLAQIAVPTLIIVGSDDMPDISSIASRLARGIPNARSVVVPNAAHLVNMEQPARFNELVREFLDVQLSGARS